MDNRAKDKLLQAARKKLYSRKYHPSGSYHFFYFDDGIAG
jgi:hypothetical protein